jgi:hypothetical protein
MCGFGMVKTVFSIDRHTLGPAYRVGPSRTWGRFSSPTLRLMPQKTLEEASTQYVHPGDSEMEKTGSAPGPHTGRRLSV